MAIEINNVPLALLNLVRSSLYSDEDVLYTSRPEHQQEGFDYPHIMLPVPSSSVTSNINSDALHLCLQSSECTCGIKFPRIRQSRVECRCKCWNCLFNQTDCYGHGIRFVCRYNSRYDPEDEIPYHKYFMLYQILGIPNFDLRLLFDDVITKIIRHYTSRNCRVWCSRLGMCLTCESAICNCRVARRSDLTSLPIELKNEISELLDEDFNDLVDQYWNIDDEAEVIEDQNYDQIEISDEYDQINNDKEIEVIDNENNKDEIIIKTTFSALSIPFQTPIQITSESTIKIIFELLTFEFINVSLLFNIKENDYGCSLHGPPPP